VAAGSAEFLHVVTGEPTGGEKLSERLNHLATSLFKFTQDRLDLLRWEVAQEGARLGSMLVYGFCAALLAFLTVEVFAVLLISTFWDTQWRVPVILALLVASLAATAVMFRAFSAKRGERSALLHEHQILGS
jgi:uncharacterized membrane protein YqjE